MTDLNALLKDFKDKRLAYKEINRTAHEALLDGIVAEIEALKALAVPPMMAPAAALMAMGQLPAATIDKVNQLAAQMDEAPKRGPGRPPKPEAAA